LIWRPWAATSLVVALTMTGCGTPDLGDAPFLCNFGTPECPEGYSCQTHGLSKICVRNGSSWKPPGVKSDATRPEAGSGPELGITLDGGRDAAGDGPAPSRDRGPPPDTRVQPTDRGIVKKDAPHLGCQSNAECKKKDSSLPCCCPTIPPLPPLPAIWACLPACLNPLCI
jgi:hypothetical protein